jgi:chromate reductase
MPHQYRLLGISGSLRANAYSTAVLHALTAATAPQATWEHADIGTLPHFNQDLFGDALPAIVRDFRETVSRADGLLIVSPEYNHGIPGVLKNAFDWASRPHNQAPLKNKPALIVTCSPAVTGGVRAQYQIRETLVTTLARPVVTPEILVGLVDKKIVDGRFHDPAVIDFAMHGFARLFEEIARLSGR